MCVWLEWDKTSLLFHSIVPGNGANKTVVKLHFVGKTLVYCYC